MEPFHYQADVARSANLTKPRERYRIGWGLGHQHSIAFGRIDPRILDRRLSDRSHCRAAIGECGLGWSELSGTRQREYRLCADLARSIG